MPVTRRYIPAKPFDEVSVFGMDYSFILPKGVGITRGTLEIWTNSNPPYPADQDWDFFPNPATRQGWEQGLLAVVLVRDRTLYCKLGGGVDGVDYLFVWTAYDTEGNVWPRSAAVLVADTS
jgi:hypothetical protein